MGQPIGYHVTPWNMERPISLAIRYIICYNEQWNDMWDANGMDNHPWGDRLSMGRRVGHPISHRIGQITPHCTSRVMYNAMPRRY